jgi:hypothetical protein
MVGDITSKSRHARTLIMKYESSAGESFLKNQAGLDIFLCILYGKSVVCTVEYVLVIPLDLHWYCIFY